MKLYAPICLLVFLFLFMPSPVYAADEPIAKTFCSNAFGYQNLDTLKADLLTNAKRDAVNELFGELIAASTTVDNFVVTSDQIRASSIGFVRIEGNVSFYNGDNLAEVCVTIRAYATDDDRKQFQPVQLDKRNCVTDANLTTSALTAFAKQEAIVQALIDYDGNLASKDKALLPPLLQRISYLESGFVSETETYCVRVTGEVVPIEVIAFLDPGELPPGPGEQPANPTPTVVGPGATLSKEATGASQKVDCAASIEFNQTMECEIESEGQKITHEFTAEADDAVRVTIVRTRGNLFPGFTVFDAGGNIVKDDGNDCSTYATSIVNFVCRVPDTGTYSIRVYSNDSDRTGKYNLHLQRMNNPVGAMPLEYGQSIDGNIDAVAEVQNYTFNAVADDAVRVTIVRTRGNLFPGFTIRDAGGNIVKDDGSECSAYATSTVDFICRVPDTGTYSIRVYSNDSDRTGKYTLTLTKN